MCIDTHINCKVCDEIIDPYTNFNGAAGEIWEEVNSSSTLMAGLHVRLNQYADDGLYY